MVFASRGSGFPRRELVQVGLIVAALVILELIAWLPSAASAPT